MHAELASPRFIAARLKLNSFYWAAQLNSSNRKRPQAPPVLVFNEILIISRELIETQLKIFPIIAPTSANLTTDERSASQQPSKTKKKHQKKNKTKQHTNTQIVLTCAN